MPLFKYLRKRRALRQQKRQAQELSKHLEEVIQKAYRLVGQQQANEAEALRAVLEYLSKDHTHIALVDVVASWPTPCQERTLLSCQILLMQDNSKLFVLNSGGTRVMMTRSPRRSDELHRAA